MNKLLIIFCLLIPTVIFGQRFNGGILVGLNASQIDGDTWSGYNKAGLLAGAYVFTEFTEKWGGQMELKYSSKGSATSKDNPNIGKLRFQYIDLPILATFKIMDDLNAQAGISLNYLFKAEQWVGGWLELDEAFHDIETTMSVGVNYRFFRKFDLNIRFSYSLFPIRGEITGSSYGQGSWFNNYLSFGFYYQIGGQEEE